MKRRIALGLALAALLAPGCAKSGSPGDKSKEAPVGIPVMVASAAVEPMSDRVTVTGTIRAQQEAAIQPQISAEVVEVKVREGDLVRAGQVLLTLERTQWESQARQARAGAAATEARLAASRSRLEILEQGAREEEREIARSRLEQAESALRMAAADLQRMQGLFEQGAISKQQLDAAQTAFDVARTNRDSARQSLELTEKGPRAAEIEAARKEVEAGAAGLEQAQAARAQAEELLSYTVIRSPIAGVVHERNIEPGELASQGGQIPMLRVADPTAVYYEATVSERMAPKVCPGQRVELSVQVNGERRLQGEVARLVPVANPDSRDFLVRISISGSTEAARPGVFARGSIVVEERTEAVVIPKDALVDREGRTIAYVVSGGVARERQVEVGLTDRTRAEILSGLEAGETLVVVGAQGLADGDAVEVRESGGR